MSRVPPTAKCGSYLRILYAYTPNSGHLEPSQTRNPRHNNLGSLGQYIVDKYAQPLEHDSAIRGCLEHCNPRARVSAMTGSSSKSLRCLAPALVAAWLGLVPCLKPALAQAPVDLELVLAVDVSLSMDLDEQRLQRDGYVAAFRDREVQKAITSGPHGRIAVTYMEWAGPPTQQVVIPWATIDSAQAANDLADRLEKSPISRARMTSISAALQFSGRLFEASGVKGIRRIIDVSGDGPNNAGDPVVPVRDRLVASGIVINGLPVMLKLAAGFFDLADLDRYYADCVIGGTGSFMIPIKERSEFQTATRRKLLLEIAGYAPAPRFIRVQASTPERQSDCLVGEQQWRRYMDGRFPN